MRFRKLTGYGSVLIGIGANAFVGGKIWIPFQSFGLVGGATMLVDGKTVLDSGRVR